MAQYQWSRPVELWFRNHSSLIGGTVGRDDCVRRRMKAVTAARSAATALGATSHRIRCEGASSLRVVMAAMEPSTHLPDPDGAGESKLNPMLYCEFLTAQHGLLSPPHVAR